MNKILGFIEQNVEKIRPESYHLIAYMFKYLENNDDFMASKFTIFGNIYQDYTKHLLNYQQLYGILALSTSKNLMHEQTLKILNLKFQETLVSNSPNFHYLTKIYSLIEEKGTESEILQEMKSNVLDLLYASLNICIKTFALEAGEEGFSILIDNGYEDVVGDFKDFVRRDILVDYFSPEIYEKVLDRYGGDIVLEGKLSQLREKEGLWMRCEEDIMLSKPL